MDVVTLQVSMNLIMTMRSTCELETYIVAVERIKEYAEAETEVLSLSNSQNFRDEAICTILYFLPGCLLDPQQQTRH